MRYDKKKTILLKSAIVVSIGPITNPSGIVSTQSFTGTISSEITTDSQGKYTTPTECFNFVMKNDFLDVQNSFTPFGAQVNSVSIIPANQNFYSWFTVSFSFFVNLQAGSTIKIQVTDKTISLTDQLQIDCYSSSGFALFYDCKTENSGGKTYISFIILEPYVQNTEMVFDVIGYSRFVQSLTDQVFDKVLVDDFFVSAYSDSLLVAQSTDPAKSTMYLYDYPQTTGLIASLNINPINEGEIARYVFNFSFDFLKIESTDKIWIRFPAEFDLNLGNRDLQVSSNLQGAFKIKRRNREVVVYDLFDQNLKNGFTLELFGIQNPNRNFVDRISNFLIGVMGNDNQLKIFINNVQGPLLIETPQILELVAMNSTSPIFRSDNDYELLLNPKVIMPDSSRGGEIRLLFPDDYIMDVFFSHCSTQEAFALYSFCTIKDNLITVQSANKDFNPEVQGGVVLDITTVRNSEEESYGGNVIVYNTNKLQSTVLTRSFPNLSESYLLFQSDGLEILINENKPFELEVGSFSDPVTIHAVESIKQRISVLPVYYDSNFLFSKYPIVLTKGSVMETFSLAVPQDMLHNRFYITMSKAGDRLPQFYASIKKFAIDVVPVRNKRIVSFEDTLYANRGGMSIPMKISTPNFPYELVRVDIQITNDYFGKIELMNNFVDLTNVNGWQYFHVNNIDPDFPFDTLEFQYSLSGPNSNSFELAGKTLSVKLAAQDPQQPTISKLILIDINRSSATFNITCDRLCYIHCVSGYKVR